MTEEQMAAALSGQPEQWTEECLEPDQILGLVYRELPEREAGGWMAHVALCSRCRREYTETLELAKLADEVKELEAAATPVQVKPARDEWTEPKRPVATAPTIPWWRRFFTPASGFAFGAAAAALVLLLVTAPMRRENRRLSSQVVGMNETVARALEEKKSAVERLRLAQEQGTGEAARLALEAEELRAAVEKQNQRVAKLERESSALKEISLPLPQWLDSALGGRVRSGGSPIDRSLAIELLTPSGVSVQTATPTLEFGSARGASDYQVILEVADSNEEAPPLKALFPTRWQPVRPLKAGTVYAWSVTAHRGGEQVRSKVGRFYVLSDRERSELREARTRLAGNPVALAAVYARFGLLQDAENQLKAVLNAEQSHPVAGRWMRELRLRRSGGGL